MATVLSNETIQNYERFFSNTGSGFLSVRENKEATKLWISHLGTTVDNRFDLQPAQLMLSMTRYRPLDRPTAAQLGALISDFEGEQLYSGFCCLQDSVTDVGFNGNSSLAFTNDTTLVEDWTQTNDAASVLQNPDQQWDSWRDEAPSLKEALPQSQQPRIVRPELQPTCVTECSEDPTTEEELSSSSRSTPVPEDGLSVVKDANNGPARRHPFLVSRDR